MGHAGCLTNDGTVYMWGCGSNYALGTEKSSHEPTPVVPSFFQDKKVVDMQCGGFHSLWLTEGNELYSCGSNSYGECMIGKNGSVRVPTLCEALKEQTIVSLHAGLYSSIVQTE